MTYLVMDYLYLLGYSSIRNRAEKMGWTAQIFILNKYEQGFFDISFFGTVIFDDFKKSSLTEPLSWHFLKNHPKPNGHKK